MSVLKNAVSMFYTCIDNKKQSNVVLNKKYIESAYQKGVNEVEVTMSSGEKFYLALNAQMFGDFIYQLSEVQHKKVEEVNP